VDDAAQGIYEALAGDDLTARVPGARRQLWS
jgi:hypothetical protein